MTLATSQLLQFALILLLTFLSCGKVTIQGHVSRNYIRNTQDSVLYNTLFFAFISILLAIFLPLARPVPQAMLLAAVASLSNVVFQVLYSVALTRGPVSLTVLIVNFSVLIPTAMSVFFFGEALYATQLLGILCLILALILSANKAQGEQKASKLWFVMALTCMLLSGANACIQKGFYVTEAALIPYEENTYLVMLYAFSAVFAAIVFGFNACTGKRERSTFGVSGKVIAYTALVAGVMTAFQKFYILAIANIDGTFLFPSFYGMQSLAMTLIGILFFHDRLTARQKIGVLFGIVSIALMNVKLGFTL